MIEHGYLFYVTIIVVTLTLLVVSAFIPFYGFFAKRWKGLAIGCIVQPVICVLLVMLAIWGATSYGQHDVSKMREEAMVVVRKAVNDDKRYDTWYLKADEECFYELESEGNEEDDSSYDEKELFDIVPTDSGYLYVDDRITIRIDLKKRTITATDYDEPMEVVRIDWGKIDAFYAKHRQ